MAKRDYHVVPRQEKWAVVREGGSKASSLHDTQRDAITAGKGYAQNNQTELVIHRPNGQIRDSDMVLKQAELIASDLTNH